jgi:hypothetical protein
MHTRRCGSQPSGQEPANCFTGTVRVDAPFEGTGAARVEWWNMSTTNSMAPARRASR